MRVRRISRTAARLKKPPRWRDDAALGSARRRSNAYIVFVIPIIASLIALTEAG